MSGLAIVPISIRQAKAFVRAHHRHNPGIAGAKLAIGLELDGILVGVGMLGRPISRELAKDRLCGEALRVCVLASAPKGSASKINARLKRLWQLQGGVRFITYNRDDESGASLRGSGLRRVASVKGRQWACASRPRAPSDAVDRGRWEQTLEAVPA